MNFSMQEKCVECEPSQAKTVQICCGLANGHAGEFLQGVLREGDGLRRFLVSIPAPELHSQAIFSALDGDTLSVHPAWKKKALQAFTLASVALTGSQPTGTLELRSNIPVSRGLGSSTADCVAAIRAAANHAEKFISPAEIALIAHQAECFSDGTMFEDSLVIFDHCSGRSIAQIDAALPEFDIVIAEEIAAPTLILTDEFARPEYSDAEIRNFAELLAELQLSLHTQDYKLLGNVAQASATINQRYLEKPLLERAIAIVQALSGIGVAIAHSGDVLILLFARNSLTTAKRAALSHQLQDAGLRILPILPLKTISQESCAEALQQ